MNDDDDVDDDDDDERLIFFFSRRGETIVIIIPVQRLLRERGAPFMYDCDRRVFVPPIVRCPAAAAAHRFSLSSLTRARLTV